MYLDASFNVSSNTRKCYLCKNFGETKGVNRSIKKDRQCKDKKKEVKEYLQYTTQKTDYKEN